MTCEGAPIEVILVSLFRCRICTRMQRTIPIAAVCAILSATLVFLIHPLKVTMKMTCWGTAHKVILVSLFLCSSAVPLQRTNLSSAVCATLKTVLSLHGMLPTAALSSHPPSKISTTTRIDNPGTKKLASTFFCVSDLGTPSVPPTLSLSRSDPLHSLLHLSEFIHFNELFFSIVVRVITCLTQMSEAVTRPI